MRQNIRPRPVTRVWKVFVARDGREIEQQLRRGGSARCPCCHEVLEARPKTRLSHCLPLDASGYDLDCRDCRRFWCVQLHTERSLRLVRMRRLVAAVRAIRVENRPARESPPALSPVAA